MMARSTTRSNRKPDTLMQDRTSAGSTNPLATHGRTIHVGQKRRSRSGLVVSPCPVFPKSRPQGPRCNHAHYWVANGHFRLRADSFGSPVRRDYFWHAAVPTHSHVGAPGMSF